MANEACMLEIERLGEPIGKQDQYAAAYGGMNLIEFERHGGVTVQPLLLPSATLSELEGNLMLFYTGSQRDAREVLSHQVSALESDDRVVSQMQKMVDLAYEMRDLLLRGRSRCFRHGPASRVGNEARHLCANQYIDNR